MSQPPEIAVTVAYGHPLFPVVLPLAVPQGTTAAGAIELSGLLCLHPEIDLTSHKIGIFSQVVSLDHLLQAGDRVEVYTPLTMDPKEARRLRSAKRARHR